MSITLACSLSLLRSLVLTLIALALGEGVSRQLQSQSVVGRKWLWVMLLVPFFTPDLMIGYGYANFSMSLIHYPVANELFYALLVLLKVVPLAVVFLYFSPAPPVTPEALYARRLSLPVEISRLDYLRAMLPYVLRGPVLRLIPVACLCFLVLFQEFEICSLMNTSSWTLWLFDAYVLNGWSLADTYAAVWYPLSVEFLVIGCLIVSVWKGNLLTRLSPPTGHFPHSLVRTRWVVLYLMFALIVVFLIPAGLLLKDTLVLKGWRVIDFQMPIFREIGIALAFGLVAGTCSYVTANWLVGRRQLGWGRQTAVLVLSWPGFCGSFLLGLTLLAFFQFGWLNRLYDTPVPLLLGLYLFLLPRAILILSFRNDDSLQEPVFSGQLLTQSMSVSQQKAGRQLDWTLRWRRHFWRCLPLIFWGYWDLTSASLLAPPAFMPAPLNLYNFMHYGQPTGLSSLLFATIVAPSLVFFFLYHFLKLTHFVFIHFQTRRS